MSRHCTVWVAGMDVTPDTLGDLEVQVGRSTFVDAPDAASLSLSIEWPGWAALPVIGDPVAVLGWLPGDESSARALFAGHVTDVAWEGDMVSVLAVDPSRRLDGVTVGDEPWPLEKWWDRLERVLAVARAALPEDAGWLQPDNGIPGQWAANGLWMPWRDVDRKQVLELIAELLEPVGGVWLYQPHEPVFAGERGPHPADPAQWTPCMRFVWGWWSNYQPPLRGVWWEVEVPSALIVGDPPQRAAMNLGPVCNEWKISGPTVDGAGKPLDDSWSGEARLPDAARRRYGQSSADLDTPFAWRAGGFGDGQTDPPVWLARAMLDRSGYPTWTADGVVVPLDARALDSAPEDCARIWGDLFVYTPVGMIGGRVLLEGVRGSTDPGSWVVEGLRVAWLEDGWEIEFTGLTDPAVYQGRATQPPIDPRNPVSLGEPPPATVGPGGFLLQPLLHSGGVQGAAGGYWRVVCDGVGGPEVPNSGLGTLVPTPQLPPGRVLLVVQHLPFSGAQVPDEWLEVPVTVAAAPSWGDLPDDDWDSVPEEVTWISSADHFAAGGA